jgi:SPP1 gp7 family putative phage head morphogenesis protein
MSSANVDIYDGVVDRAAMVRLYQRRVDGQIELILDGHRVRLDELMRKGNLTVSGRKQLMKAVDSELRKTYRDANRTSRKSLLDLAKSELSFAYQNIEKTMSRIWKTSRPPNRVAEEFIMRPLIENKTLEAGWFGVSLGERRRIEAIIRRGVAEGHSMEEIAVDVRRGNVHNISRAQSRALVVTATTAITAQADHAVYEANRDAIVGWQYVAVLDSRTTPTCAHRDGQVYSVDEREMLPPAHYNCRSTTIPVFKSWADVAKLESLSRVRSRNIQDLTKEQMAYYDGQTPMKESYHDWLFRQPQEVQLRHLGDYAKVRLFQSGKIHLSTFTNDEGNSIGIRELKAMTESGYNVPGTTRRFAAAKAELDAMNLGAVTPDDFINDLKLRNTLRDYYILQSRDLDGTLSLTNYRGLLINTKRSAKRRVLTSPPREDQMVFNPITGRYEDTRLYQPNPGVLANNLKLMRESDLLLDRDKEFIEGFIESLKDHMSVNERAVITDNLRIVFGRQRQSGELWTNFKAVTQGQVKFDVMNVSDAVETQLRRDADILKKLLQDNYIDPVLGPTQLQELHNGFINNIFEKNRWEDRVAPKIARKLRSTLDTDLLKQHPVLWNRISSQELDKFYLKFANRLGLADTPDRDQLAVQLGRDLYNAANINGARDKWYDLGMSILNNRKTSKFFEIETFGVQKRRMKSRMSGQYFGPYYDTMAFNVRIVDPEIQRYAHLTRKVELGLRLGTMDPDNQLIVRPGYKTFFVRRGLGWSDTRIPIVSSSSFSDFPVEFVDKDFADALNWASKSRYKIDKDYYNFVNKLLYFEDDRGRAKHYNERNEFRKYIASRGDSYERFKAMEWLTKNDASFGNQVFVDHRARIYERGLIGPQSGETFRPFLNTEAEKPLGTMGFLNLQDQIGAFLGGLDDHFEGRHDSLTFVGRQKIAERWRPELVRLGNHMLRGKPADIRAVLDSEIAARIDGEELAKFFRLAMEQAKIDNYLKGQYSNRSLESLRNYKTALAMEQDASSSGAQIIALTTRNKQLAELSNVVPTDRKQRLYDEIAERTFNDPRFKTMNVKLGLTEKDLRKAAKGKAMVTFYGAGERTGILNIEGKLAKVLEKEDGVLVVKASERDQVLSEISARIARVERFDPETGAELRALRANVRDVFNKGLNPGEELMEELWFLESKTRDLVEKMTANYMKVVTPDDFRNIAKIMSEHLAEETPILKDFTRYFGRLAEDYLSNAKPGKSDFDWVSIAKTKIRGTSKKGYVLPDRVSEILGIKRGEAISEKALRRMGFWNPGSTLHDMLLGVPGPHAKKAGVRSDQRRFTRRTGAKFFKMDILQPTIEVKLDGIRPKISLVKEKKISGVEIFKANKMPKKWTNIPWINFDGKALEQNFTQTFEERLVYRDGDGNWQTNILQVPQKSEATWWEEFVNKSGKINDIADATKARTAYAVNGNHSNDATVVKNFHLWGLKNGVPTSTIHDAFFTNIADMQDARRALRQTYANALKNNTIKMTLDEMKKRGLPKDLYYKYLNEAIELGLIPVVGRSRVGGRLLRDTDILLREDIMKDIPENFKSNFGWYGVG